ncbi:MAG TPA: winged helix-turn-helix transcriptional regulator [Candidatus Thermoplasmatota archaeon]
MDALDARILRQLGVEPFAGMARRPQGLRATDVARSLGRNVRLVQDRIMRMEDDGVITGYSMVPNPRHLGVGLTTLYVPTTGAADASVLEGLSDLDGFVQAIAYLGEGVCLSMSHGSADELARRLGSARRLAGDAGAPKPMYAHDLPRVERTLSALDWRIIAALAPDARRTLQDVAEEVGVTVKTLRGRLKHLRDEGSVDEVAKLDFTRMHGIMPFEVAVWCDDPVAVTPRILERLHENYWGHFRGPPGGYSDLLLRVFTTTPAEAHRLVKAAADVPGVRDARALIAAGAHDNPVWLIEAIEAQLAAASSA